MASLKNIRTRIASVKNTQKITKAMKMVSAAKLRKSQDRIVNLRPYSQRILGLIADIASTYRVSHPLLSQTHHPKKVLLVVLTSDRGLCGGFNSSVNKFALNWYEKNKSNYEQLDFIFIGKKAADFFRYRGVESKESILNLAREISYGLATKVAQRLMKDFTSGGYDSIFMIYNEFKSAISQEVVCQPLLPVDLSESRFSKEDDGKGKVATFSQDMIFEPDPEEIVDELLEKHFSTQVFRCMCESIAAEHGARMAAMENATNNAAELIDKLTLTYNKLRQASITTELIEITSGAEALNA